MRVLRTSIETLLQLSNDLDMLVSTSLSLRLFVTHLDMPPLVTGFAKRRGSGQADTRRNWSNQLKIVCQLQN